MPVVPNVFIIGAQKAGTTSLHNYLSGVPDIFTTRLKECQTMRDYSAKATRRSKSFSTIWKNKAEYHDYALSVYSGEPFVLESSPQYTTGDIARDERIPEKMLHMSPDCKLVYLMRHPFERLVSNYVHDVRAQGFLGTLGQYCKDEQKPAILTSCYSYQLRHFYKFFPPEKILVLHFDDFIQSPGATILQILEFLGVSSQGLQLQPSYTIYNATTRHTRLSTRDVRFPEKCYSVIHRRISTDVLELKGLGIDFGWDISPERWVQKDNTYEFDAFPLMGNLSLKRNPSLPLFLRYFEVAEDRSSLHITFRDFLAYLHSIQTSIESIKSEAHKAMEMCGNEWRFFYELGTFLRQVQDMSGAQEAQMMAIQLNPSVPYPYLELSQIHDHLGEKEISLRFAQEAARISKTMPISESSRSNSIVVPVTKSDAVLSADKGFGGAIK